MKFVFKEGLIFLDGEPYGITNVNVEEQTTDADARDSLSGSNYESIQGSARVNFTFNLFINSVNTKPVAGKDYSMLISTEAFAFYGTGRIVAQGNAAAIGEGISLACQGNFQGTPARYGYEILSNPYQQLINGSIPDKWALSLGSTSILQDAQGRNYVQMDIDSVSSLYRQWNTQLAVDKIWPVSGNTITSFVQYYVNTEVEQSLSVKPNAPNAITLANVAGERRFEINDLVLSADLTSGTTYCALKIDNTGGSTGFLLDLFYFSLRKKII